MKKITITNVQWDFDEYIPSSPVNGDDFTIYLDHTDMSEIEEDEDMTVESYSMERLSDMTGWCIQDCQIEITDFDENQIEVEDFEIETNDQPYRIYYNNKHDDIDIIVNLKNGLSVNIDRNEFNEIMSEDLSPMKSGGYSIGVGFNLDQLIRGMIEDEINMSDDEVMDKEGYSDEDKEKYYINPLDEDDFDLTEDGQVEYEDKLSTLVDMIFEDNFEEITDCLKKKLESGDYKLGYTKNDEYNRYCENQDKLYFIKK